MSLIHYYLIKTYGTKHVREVDQIYHTGMKYMFQWLKEDICKCIMICYVICGEILLLLLQNTDLLHQVKDYVIDCTWQFKNIKTIYRFQKLIFNRGDISLESLNPATQNHWLSQPSLVRETRFLYLLRLTRNFFYLLENRIYLLKVQLNTLLKCQNKHFKVSEHNILKCQNTPFQIIRIWLRVSRIC